MEAATARGPFINGRFKKEVSMRAKKILFSGLIATLAGCGTIGNSIVSDPELARKAAFTLDTSAD